MKSTAEKNELFSIKGMLRLIFCIDINTHSDRKSKNYVKFILKNYFFNVLVFIDFFIDTITPLTSSTQTACDVMYVNM